MRRGLFSAGIGRPSRLYEIVPVRDRKPVPASIDSTSDGCRQYCFVCSATT